MLFMSAHAGLSQSSAADFIDAAIGAGIFSRKAWYNPFQSRAITRVFVVREKGLYGLLCQ